MTRKIGVMLSFFLSKEGDRLINCLSWPIRGRRWRPIVNSGRFDVLVGTIASKQCQRLMD